MAKGDLAGSKLPQEGGKAPHVRSLRVDRLRRLAKGLGGHPGANVIKLFTAVSYKFS